MKRIAQFCSKNTIVPIIIVLFIVFSFAGRSFLTVNNALNILMQSSIYGVMALGMTFLIVCGYFDLSAGLVMGLTANLTVLLQIAGLPIWLSVIVGLAASLIVGIINGFLVTCLKINAFIVTLAMMLALRGIVYFLCDANQINSPYREFSRYASEDFFGISYLTLTFIAVFIISFILLRHTKHGRDTYAIGGNADAAYNAGIRVQNVRFINFVLCSFTAGVGGIMTAARLGGATPYLGYPDGALLVITCVVLGGTSLLGGKGGMLFTVGGTIALFMFRNGLNMMNVPAAFNYITTGIILIAIVALEAFSLTSKGGKGAKLPGAS